MFNLEYRLTIAGYARLHGLHTRSSLPQSPVTLLTMRRQRFRTAGIDCRAVECRPIAQGSFEISILGHDPARTAAITQRLLKFLISGPRLCAQPVLRLKLAFSPASFPFSSSFQIPSGIDAEPWNAWAVTVLGQSTSMTTLVSHTHPQFPTSTRSNHGSRSNVDGFLHPCAYQAAICSENLAIPAALGLSPLHAPPPPLPPGATVAQFISMMRNEGSVGTSTCTRG
ncbi:hypothetical protein N657DRAFT_268691 [Parathielavia appendiculata]|uniref:Uncharacterized protein n=1 Tax=Parathielavia appendiculata TaxID=2587402 RepID=A0AAN6U314_9PEZI|nr:hypothetical protein N657DRAFT_268691 [Parathielavia appendiculata]